MTVALNNLHHAMPEMIVLASGCLSLLADLFLAKRWKSGSLTIACIGLLLAALCSMLFIGDFKTVILGGLFVSDDTTHLMKLFMCLCVFAGFIYSRDYLETHKMPAADFYTLGTFCTLGMMVMVSAHSLLTVYLGLELVSLPLYAMTAMRRSAGDSSEAAMKYFVMGGIASAMVLYGISLVYGATGKLGLMDIANAVTANWQQESTLLSFALVFIVSGLAFKLAAIPFHMWAPDVYEGAPTPVTLFISAAPKIAVLGVLLQVLTQGLFDLSGEWQRLLLVMALLSTAFGNLFAVVQTNIKRLFAYSAISHMGYALFGLLTANPAGYSAALYYLLVYALMTVAAFGLLVLMARSGLEADTVDSLKGLNQRNPWLAFLMMVVLFSMAGVPPTAGFIAKLMVLKALVDAQLLWVAVLGLLFAVIGAYYYLRIVKVMYFDDPVETDALTIGKAKSALYSLNCLSLLYFGIFPSLLVTACINAFAL